MQKSNHQKMEESVAPRPSQSYSSTLITMMALAVMSGIVYWRFLIFDRLFLFNDIGSDTINFNYPHLAHVANYLRESGWPLWSFNQGMGQNIFPMGLIGDPSGPINLLLYALGSRYLVYALGYVEVMKILLSGLIFHMYLNQRGFSYFSRIIGSLLFSFSGYIILGGTWFIFSTEALYAALSLLAFEKYFQNRSWFLIPISVALFAALQPLHIYLYGLFIFIYGTMRYLEEPSFRNTAFLAFWRKYVLYALLGVLISTVFTWSAILQIIQSPRVSGNSSYFKILSSQPLGAIAPAIQLISAIGRLFSNDMFGGGNRFMGWNNYLEAPIFYIGLLTLFWIPQVFVKQSRKNIVLYSCMLLIVVIPIVFPYFRYAYWLFSGDYYRSFSLLFVFILLYLSLVGLDRFERNRIYNQTLFVISGFACIVVQWIMVSQFYLVDKTIYWWLLAGLTGYIAIFLFLFPAKSFWPLLVLLILELTTQAYKTINGRSSISGSDWIQRKGYYDYTVEAVQFLRKSDPSFYRVIKDYASGTAENSSLNDAQVQNYYGTHSYYSFNQKYYIDFLSQLEMIHGGVENQTRWASGLINRPILQSLCSVKYFFAKQDDEQALVSGYEWLTRFGDVNVYRNRYALPLGYCYSQLVSLDAFQHMQTAQKELTLLHAAVISENGNRAVGALTYLSEHQLDVEPITLSQYEAGVRSLRADTLSHIIRGQNHISGTISLTVPRVLFFSIPFDRGWRVMVDGRKENLLNVNIGFMGVALPPGHHTIELKFIPHYLLPGVLASTMGLFLYAAMLWSYRKKTIAGQHG